MSDDRWWAPQRATLEPDAVVLAMLEVGDLGSSVLAVHRAGAAAIGTVAKSSVPSEAELISAMVTARSNAADRIVDSISKSVSTPAYAGLLAMDVFDDAEAGALHVYRTAVAKGVAPSVAAQRAGDIFGVPSNLMGKYAMTATDPRANPVTTRELADHTLLDYVSKLVKAESPEPVTKADQGAYAEAPKPKKPWREDEVVRDALGQFAEEEKHEKAKEGLSRLREALGISGSAPAEVAGAPTRERRAPARPKRAQRATRLVRTGTKRAEPARHEAKRAETKRAKAERVTKRARAKQDVARSVNRVTNRAVEAQEKKALKKAGPVGDVLATVPGSEHEQYYELDHELVLRTDLSSSAAFRTAMREQSGRFRNPNEMVFRMNALVGVTGGNTTTERPGSKHDTEAREAFAHAILEESDSISPDVTIVHAVDLSSSGEDERRYIERRRQEATRSGATGLTDHDEDLHVEALPTYLPYGWDADDDETAGAHGEYAIVHHLPTDLENPYDRPIPTIDEFVIVGSAKGAVEGTTKYEAYTLDPNQAYRVIAPPGSRPGTRVSSDRFWDAENSVVVNRWYIEQISDYELDEMLGDDDVQKADDQAYQRAPVQHVPWREAEVVRDALGRFAEEAQAAEQAAPAAPLQRERIQRMPIRRATRATRATRVRRAERPAATEDRREPKRAQTRRAEPSPFQRALQRASTRRAITRAEQTPDMPLLDDGRDYKVYTQTQWQAAIELLDHTDLDALHSGAEIRLDPLTRRAFREGTVHSVYDLHDEMARNVDNDPSMRSKQFKVLSRLQIDQAQDLDVLAEKIESLFDAHPEVDKLEMVRRGSTLWLSGNTELVGDQSIIEVDPEVDWSQPVFLKYVGHYRARELGTRNQHGEIGALISPTGSATGDNVEGVVANPEVHLYRISTKHYRAGN